MAGRSAHEELREQVAQAISDATLDWCGETPEIWDSHRMAADAALAVVRAELAEPSEAMMHQGASSHDHPSVYMGGPSMPGRRRAERMWRAMLAASPLAEPGP